MDEKMGPAARMSPQDRTSTTVLNFCFSATFYRTTSKNPAVESNIVFHDRCFSGCYEKFTLKLLFQITS